VFDTNDMNTLDMATQHSGEEDEGRMAALAAMLREQGARHSMMYMRWPNMTMADSALALQECFRGHQARSACLLSEDGYGNTALQHDCAGS